MSCNRNGNRCAGAAARNGIAGHLSRSLSALASWQTVDRLLFSGLKKEDLPTAATNALLSAAGLKWEDGRVKLAGVLGLIIAVHGLEHASGAAATLLARNLVRGRAYGRYRGVILRRNPLLKRAQAIRGGLSRGKVTGVAGYYFHQGGRTWTCTMTDFRAREGSRQMTALKGVSYPNRGFYFDRPLDERDAVDIVLGDRDPDTVPGYLGSTNELDSLIGTGRLKRGLMGLNWLTVDDSERDTRGPDFVDYGTLETAPAGRWTDYRPYRHERTVSPGHTRSVSYADLVKEVGRQADTTGVPVMEGYGGPPKTEERPPDPATFVSDLWGNKSGDRPEAPPKITRTIKYADLAAELGQELAPPQIELGGLGKRPLRVEAIDQYEGGAIRAEAYYQDTDEQWTPIADEKIEEAIAKTITDNFQAISRRS